MLAHKVGDRAAHVQHADHELFKYNSWFRVILHSQQQGCAGIEAARYTDFQAVKTGVPVGAVQQIYFALQ